MGFQVLGFLSTISFLFLRQVFAQEPCALAASAVSDWIDANPDLLNTTNPSIPAEVAYDCLQSVPIQQDEDMLLIEELTLYLHWQSNLAYLVDPPDGYKGDRVNISEAIESIYSGLEQGNYTSEYDFALDLQRALQYAQDFHFQYTPDILSVFAFRRGSGDDRPTIVSISSDGKALPQVYTYNDAMVLAHTKNATVSPISEINGQSTEDYLNMWSSNMEFLDADARYNQMFQNQASASTGGDVSMFVYDNNFDGPWTNITYANGTSEAYANVAQVLKDVRNITTGEEFFAAFCTGPTNVQKRDLASLTKRDTPEPELTGFPKPEIVQVDGASSGHYLEGSGYDDVAVLSIPTFQPKDTDSFQETTRIFLENSVRSGKKKLVIDLRANGGGYLMLGYDTFKQLFPQEEPWGATRFRANDAFGFIGSAVSTFLKDYVYEDAVEDMRDKTFQGLISNVWASAFNYREPLTKDNQPFESWSELFGPVEIHGDNFTTLQRKNFSSVFESPQVYGYGEQMAKLNIQQPFAAENIVMIMDGGCGSTCASFAELMKSQGKVQQVVFGGAPHNNPMQGVAGSKGGQVITYAEISEFAKGAYDTLSENGYDVNNTELQFLAMADRPLTRASYSSDGDPSARVNFRDAFTPGNDNLPLEFIYEASDCKLWYTAEMIADPTKVWKAAADARWKNFQGCVEGSTGDKSSLSGAQGLGQGHGDNRTATATPTPTGHHLVPRPSETGAGLRLAVPMGIMALGAVFAAALVL